MAITFNDVVLAAEEITQVGEKPTIEKIGSSDFSMGAVLTFRNKNSKGQVVIPEEIRKTLKLTEGNQFVVLGKKDVIHPVPGLLLISHIS